MSAGVKAYSYIRLSTALQRKGSGRQRQLDKSIAYASANNLDLVADPLEDIGISAYKGRNVTEGVLGQFIEAAKTGKIERGSFLLVESLDRLSRQQVQRALTTFLNILEGGITIVTLGDGDKRTYVPDKVDVSDLVMTIMIMGRAHEESQTKADRIRANWANKRANARVHPMTAMCPAWLQLSTDRKSYREIESRVATIRRIFEEAAAGVGVYAITRRLNEQKVPHFGKSQGWHQSYISKILKNRAVLGEFQPHKIVDDKRQPDGDHPIQGYFPNIVSEETFNRVQYGLAQRRNNGAGRKGKNYSNLFSGLPIKCQHCSGVVKFENKGSGPKGGNYLVCDNVRRGLGCVALRWRYDHFEASVLYFLSEQIDLTSIIRGNQEGEQRYVLENAIEALQGKRHDLEGKRERRLGLIDTMPDGTEYVADQLQQIGRELRDVNVQLENLIKDRELLISEAQAMANSDIRSLVESLATAADQDRYKVRSDLASNLKKLVSRIDVGFSQPEEYIRATNDRIKESIEETKREIEKLKKQGRDVSHPAYSVTEYTPIPDKMIDEWVEVGTKPSFTVTLKTGQKETARPAKDDAFDPIIMAGRKSMKWLAGMGYDVSNPINAIIAYYKDHTGKDGEFVPTPQNKK
jgi:DNA invertase Pin-like site-specific DNA recombinase